MPQYPDFYVGSGCQIQDLTLVQAFHLLTEPSLQHPYPFF